MDLKDFFEYLLGVMYWFYGVCFYVVLGDWYFDDVQFSFVCEEEDFDVEGEVIDGLFWKQGFCCGCRKVFEVVLCVCKIWNEQGCDQFIEDVFYEVLIFGFVDMDGVWIFLCSDGEVVIVEVGGKKVGDFFDWYGKVGVVEEVVGCVGGEYFGMYCIFFVVVGFGLEEQVGFCLGEVMDDIIGFVF